MVLSTSTYRPAAVKRAEGDSSTIKPGSSLGISEHHQRLVGANATNPLPSHIPRGDLVRRLEAALDKKLILVTAPAGYGKTALLRELWDALEDRDCVRVRPVPSGGAAEFAAALVNACAQAGLDAAPTSSDAHETAAPEAMLAALARHISSFPCDIVIFIDNNDAGRHEEIGRLVKILLHQTPDNVRVVLAVRSEPACGAAKMRLDGTLAEFTRSDLAFSDAEIHELLRKDGLTQSDIECLTAKTLGWPAALGLAKLWIRGGDDASSRAAAFSGDLPMVANYIAQEVFAEVPADVQKFLIETALFSTFDKELADAVLLRRDADAMLHRLKSLDGFIFYADRSRGQYRHHPLIADYLRGRLHEIGDAEYINALHKRAAAYFDRRGAPLLALGHAMDAGDDAALETIIGNPAFGFIQMAANERSFMQIMERLEQCVPNKAPRLLPGSALRLIRQGRLLEAKDLLDRAQKGRQAPDRNQPSTFEQADLCLIEAIYHVCADTPDLEALMARLEAVRTARPMDEPVYAGALNEALGVFQFRSRRVGDADDAFRIAADNFAQAQAHGGSIRNSLHRGMIAMMKGDIMGAQEFHHHAQRLHQKHLPDEAVLSAMIDVSEAALHYEQGALAEAHEILPAARRAIIAGGDYSVEFLSTAYRIEARLVYRERGFDAAFSILDQGVTLAHERQLKRLQKSLIAQKLHLAAIAGKLSMAQQIQDKIDQRFKPLENAVSRFGWREEAERYFAEIRFAIARRRGDLALAMLDEIDKIFTTMDLTWFRLKSSALRTLALAADGETVEAISLLRELLIQGERLGLRSFFLEEGFGAQSLLDGAAERFSRTKKAEEFKCLIVKWLVRSSSFLPPDRRITAPDLTKQQRQILTLLVQGFDRNAIAEQAGTTTHNVQYHIKKMFDLLGVASSGRLTAEAIRLGLAHDPGA